MSTSKSAASINGISIAYRDRGAGAAVVFIHGHPFDQTMWDPQAGALSWKYRVITLDLRGYGASEVPSVDTTTLETMAADIKGLLDHLGIQKAVVVGLSMGGQVAMAFADLFPERIEGLVLAGTFAEADTTEAAAARRAMADRFVNEGSVLPGGEMLPKLLATASVKRDPMLAVTVYTMIANTPPEGAAAALRGRALRKDYLPTLRRLAVPVLIMVGIQDQFSPLERAQQMYEAIPSARLVVFNEAGHLLNLEASNQFNASLLEYLESIPR